MPPIITPISDSLLEEVSSKLKKNTGAEVRFDQGSRAIYASDLSHYRQVPIGVVVPHTVDDVIATVAVCREYGIPILGRGAGTSLAGQTCNVAVVIDFSKYLNRLLELRPRERYAWVEPGLINDHLRNAAEDHKLTFAPDPATHEYCTIGGMIGNNSCGPHSVMGGKTSENIEELDILTYDGVRMTVGTTSEKELESIIRRGGRRGDIYRKLRNIRDTYATEVRERFPDPGSRFDDGMHSFENASLDELRHLHLARARFEARKRARKRTARGKDVVDRSCVHPCVRGGGA